jgi:hypothetical protein
MSQERYFLHLNGLQRGPYTVQQIGHMVNSGIVHSEAMFWCEGLEQWQPVTQLIVPKGEVTRRRLKFGAGSAVVVAGLLVLFWVCLPFLREGWKEQHQVAQDAPAAYWRARGVLRESLGWFTGLRFRDYDPSMVRLEEAGRAVVELEAQAGKVFGGHESARWRVELTYDRRLRMWMPAESNGGGLLPSSGKTTE